MKSLFFFIAANTPRYLLPKATKCVASQSGGYSVELSEQEKRELLVRRLSWKFKQLRESSPLHVLKKHLRAKKLEAKRKSLYQVIGEMALIHAGIEQNLKAVLFCDLDISFSEKEQKGLCGRNLRVKFEEEIKRSGLSDELSDEYLSMIERFRSLSQSRNGSLKTIYGFHEESLDMFLVNQVVHKNMDQIMRGNGGDFKDFQDKWMKPVKFEDIECLLADLRILHTEFLRLRSKGIAEKVRQIYDTGAGVTVRFGNQ